MTSGKRQTLIRLPQKNIEEIERLLGNLKRRVSEIFQKTKNIQKLRASDAKGRKNE